MEQPTPRPVWHHPAGASFLIRVLLLCGVASSVVYSVTEILASMRWAGYHWADRMVSDLLAVSAPTRSFIVGPMLAYNALVLAFGIGVWLSRRNRAQGVTAILLIAYAIAGVIGLLVFPLDYNRAGSGAAMHMVATFTLIILMFAFIVSAAVGSGRGFRIYSVLTVLIIIGGAVLSGMQVPRLEAGLPTPGLGLFERLNIYAMLLWVIAYSVTLWPRRDRAVTAP
ncbi:MAG: DUF998 domain-containing protein [Thermoleophilia bacterium]